MARHFLFTSESVTEGHPDKICDQISDAVLDAILAQDPMGRVACETTVSTGLVHIMGEITTNCYVDIPKIAREVIRDIGYDRAKYGFDCDTCGIISNIDEQSADIAMGVDNALETRHDEEADLQNGAGDQGMMFGYACDETAELMPLPISLAQKMAKRLTEVRKVGLVNYLRPDGKTQVTVEYDENGKPVRVDTVVLSTQHSPTVTLEQIREDMINMVNRFYGINMDLDLSYYGSENFTKVFYRLSDQRVFVDNNVPAVLFTSGITMNTNKTYDSVTSINIPIFRKRIYLIYHWIDRMI